MTKLAVRSKLDRLLQLVNVATFRYMFIVVSSFRSDISLHPILF